MATITPTYTETTLLSAQVLARGSTVRATMDLRAKYGAWVHVGIGRTGTTALTTGVGVLLRRTLGNDATIFPAALPMMTTDILAAVASTISGSNSNSGQPAINVASIGAIVFNDLVTIAASSDNLTRLEFARVSKTATGVLTADANLKQSHTTAQADAVRNKAEAFAVWCDGGATWELVVDYGASTSGESVVVLATAQTFDSNVSA